MSIRSLLLVALCAWPAFAGQTTEEAWELWNAGERAKALAILEERLAESPHDARLRTGLVEAELSVQRFEAALAHSDGLPPESAGLRGRALYFLTRYSEALEHLGAEREEQLMRAECLRALARFDELDALVVQLGRDLGDEDLDVQLLVARGHLRRGEGAQAIPLLRRVLAARPLEPEALFALGRALVRTDAREEGLALLERHRALIPLLDALDFAQRGVALAPNGAANQAGLGDAWRALVPFSPAAKERASAAYAAALANATPAEVTPIALRAARLHWEVLGDPEGALDLLALQQRRSGDVRLRVRRADYLTELGRYGEARGELQQALLDRPGDRAIEQRLERVRALEEAE